ncbi:DUF927 domain-containing protein [Deinococcus altitudinis]|uniref:DUF927 domain-containing protein n=1 Tax=Deinococcus altitudinis TaxID=468914 RepID=UPI0038913A9F
MSALTDALSHPHNRPGPLVSWLAAEVNPAADLRGLEDGGGVVCDFRPGLEEKDPSLSVSIGAAGVVFHRFGGDGFEGGALDFTAVCLGVSKGEAARLLIDRAGLVDTPPADRPSMTVKAKKGAAVLLGKLAKLKPLPDTDRLSRLKGWHTLTPDSSGPEAEELARRGLLAHTGPDAALTAYHFTGRSELEGTGKASKVYRLPGHILPGAVAFEVRGPDGTPWALKVRNPGTAEELGGVNRYAYIGKGQHAPAWCSPGFDGTGAELVIEGELNAAAVYAALDAAGYGASMGVQGVASAAALPHAAHVRPGRDVWIYADGDAAGEKGRNVWAELMHAQGATVRMLPAPNTFTYCPDPDGQPHEYVHDGDACDWLGADPGKFSTRADRAAYLGGQLMKAMEAAPIWTPPAKAEAGQGEGEGVAQEDGDVWLSKRSGYGVRGGQLCALTVKKGEESGEDFEAVEVLCNFTAYITAEVTLEDGTGEAARVFELEGTRADGRPMNPPRVTVSAQEFGGMSWPVAKWGAAAVVHAGQGKKDKARVALQLLSGARGVNERTVYQHTGWIQHPEHGPVYLTAGAVIGAQGAVSGVDVELSGRLAAYSLPGPLSSTPGEAEALREAVRESLALLELAPDAVSVPVLGAVYRATLGRADFAVWLTGETGRQKTALMGLAMSHYGAGWNRRYLPDGWNSTANALERSAFTVKDALFVADDFKPAGAAADVAKAHGGVARILQGVADGTGRATLTADRRQRAGVYPRGLVMSSSETLPRGHSNLARAVIVDVDRPLIGTDPVMSRAYYRGEDLGAAGVYALAMAGYVQQIAGDFEAVRAGSPAHRQAVQALAPHFEGAHGRTAGAASELAYGWRVFLSFAVKVGAVSEAQARDTWARVLLALQGTAKGQGAHLTAEDPVSRALRLLDGLLSQGRVFLEDLGEGGQPPEGAAELCGWQRVALTGEGGSGDTYRTRPGAVLLGWYSKTGGDEWAHLLPDALHEALQRALSGQGGQVLPDASTLWGNMAARLHPAGLMKCETEKGRIARPTAKATPPGRGRTRFITLRIPLAYQDIGTIGTDGEERTSDTASEAVPLTLFFKGKSGTLGTAAPLPVPVFAASSSPGAAVAEADPWGIDL